MTSEEIRKICHDLQSPLAVIQGFLRSVEKGTDSEERQGLFQAAKISLEKMKGLIDHLLKSSQL